MPARVGSGVTAVIAPWTAPVTAPLAAPVAAPTRALRAVVTACAIAAPAFLVTVCFPARAFVLVLLARFAPTRLVPTFVVALAGLPLRAGFFFAEGFFRLEGTAFRALEVLRRSLRRLSSSAYASAWPSPPFDLAHDRRAVAGAALEELAGARRLLAAARAPAGGTARRNPTPSAPVEHDVADEDDAGPRGT
jgi:hypothetical protein